MSEAPIEKTTVVVNGRTIVLDPLHMNYNENSLGDYMNREYGWIDYYGKMLEHAQKEVLIAEIEYESIYSLKFLDAKDRDKSDNYAKAFALANVDVVAAKTKIAERKECVGHLKAHLKAWDKNHENVQNRGHSLRHEIKVLSRDIYESSDNIDRATCEAEDFMKK